MPSESLPASAISPSSSEQKLRSPPSTDSLTSPRSSQSGPLKPGTRSNSEKGPRPNVQSGNVKSTPSGLTVSKQWVSPPRPKPGRKPKPKPAGQDKVQRPRSSSNGTKTAQHDKPGARIKQDMKHETSMNKHEHDQDDDSCDLCSKEDCMCETIGSKSNEKRPSLPSSEMISNTVDIKMDAVPLKRRASTELSRNSSAINDQNINNNSSNRGSSGLNKTKFTRSSDVQPLHPMPVLSVPSPLEGLQYASEGCGFCTENTPCACAETSAAARPPSPQSARSSSFSNPSSPRRYSAIQFNPAMNPGQPSAMSTNFNVSQPPSSAAATYSNQTPPEEDYGCPNCQKEAMSMLFCVSLNSAQPLSPGSVAIPCHLAVKTSQKHPRFATCDLGRSIRRLEVRAKQVGVQSINRVSQELERGEFS